MRRTTTIAGLAAATVAVGTSVATFNSATAIAAPAATTFTVNTTADDGAAHPFSGQCATTAGKCSVRAAVQAANARPGSTIVIPAGRYVLRIPPNLLNTNGPLIDPTTGDLDVTAATTIEGAGQNATVIDANGIDRIFMTTADATIRGLTITGGVAREHEIPFYDTGGGGILNSARLTLDHVTLTGNSADFAGGIQNLPWSDMKMSNSIVSGNRAGETGGVRCDNTCTISHTTITDNHAVNAHKWYLPSGEAGRGGGLDIRGFADVRIDHTTITGNSATDVGGGVQIAPGYFDTVGNFPNPELSHLYVSDSLIAGNTVAGRRENCGRAFAGIVSEGGNHSDDITCGLTNPTDVTAPLPN